MLSFFELKRQLFHIGVGVTTILLVEYGIFSPFTIFLLILLGLTLSILSRSVHLPFISWCLDRFERKEQRHKFPGKGVIFFFIGALLALKLFDRDIALAAIMILTLGDSISHMYGAQFGLSKNIFHKKSRKLFEGTLAGGLAGFFGALLFVSPIEALLASFGAMFAEAIEFSLNDKPLDDNFIVPLVAGTIIVLLRMF